VIELAKFSYYSYENKRIYCTVSSQVIHYPTLANYMSLIGVKKIRTGETVPVRRSWRSYACYNCGTVGKWNIRYGAIIWHYCIECRHFDEIRVFPKKSRKRIVKK